MNTTTGSAKAAETAERNIHTMRRIYEEAFGEGKLDILDECFAPDIVNHTAPEPYRVGIEPVRGLIEMLRTAFPDARTEIEHMVADGDAVVMRNWYAGTHQGPFMGHEPTGRPFRFRQMHWMRFDDEGRVAEHWGVRDDMAHLRQLGVIG
ncbi:ester cyclase [Streptomyces sp. HUAS ZL42]|uniref:ester cyclase n=1 Tax=Streptomyces sp. HUAS ZL42 TaxID=3231715 RepID=UPI00345E89AC